MRTSATEAFAPTPAARLAPIPRVPEDVRSSYDSLFARIGAINIEYRIWNTLINTVSNSLKGVPRVGIELDSIKASLEATMGSSAGMVGALKALDVEAQRTGINIGILRDNFKGFQASTSLAGASMSSTWKMFTDMNTVISGLHLSADKANHVFLAMSQIFNKSKVQSEELVKQLGNLLPGAFASFAASMNILPAELSKRMKEGTVYAQDTMENFIAYMANRFAPAFAMSADNLNANVGRMETSFIHLQEAIYASSSGPMNDFVKGATNLTNHITALVNGTEQLSSTFTTGLKVATGLLVLELGSLIVKVGEASTAFKILEGAMAFFGPIRVAIVAAGAALAYFATEASAGSVALDKANESYREMKKLRGEVLQEKVTTDAQLLKITVETDEQVAKATKLLTKHQQEYNDALKASDADVSVNGMRLITKQETLKNIQKTIEDDNKAIVDAKKSATEKILQAEKDSLARQKEAQTKDMTDLSEHYSDMMGRYAKTAEEAGNYAAAKIATSKFKGDKAAYEKIKERFEAPASILTEKENLRPTLEQYNEALKTMAVMDEEVARARQAGIDTFNKKGESAAKKGAAERIKVTKEEINTIKQFETTAATNANSQIKLLDSQNKAKLYSFEEYVRRKKEILTKDYEAEKGFNEQQRALAVGTGKKDLIAKYDEKLKQLKSDYESKIGTGDTKGIIDNEAAQNIDAYNTNLNMIHERYQDILGIERDSNDLSSTKLELLRKQLELESKEKGEVGERAKIMTKELEILVQAQNLKANIAINQKNLTTAEKVANDALQRNQELKQVGQMTDLQYALSNTKIKREQIRLSELEVDSMKRKLDAAKPEERPAAQATYDLAKQKLESLKLVADETGAMIEQSLGNAFDNAFTGLINKSMTASQAFKSFANSVLGDIAKILAQEMRSQILGSILKPLAGAALSGLGSLGQSAGLFQATNISSTPGFIGPMKPTFAANGGVFTGAGISAHSGTIVSSPTVFPFAKGVGLMGEAGPEAILPLKRNAQGKLGVVTENAGQSKGNLYNITVNVQSKQGENPEQFGQRAAAAMMRSIAKEEISNAKRPGNTLNKARFG
jgi:tape measure domain-containing protein